MSNKLFTLLKIQYLNTSSFNRLKHEKNTKKKVRQLLLYLCFILLAFLLMIYAFSLAYGYGSLGLVNVIPYYAIAISGIITIVFTFLKTNGVLFGYKDYDLLMSLPVSTKTVITMKFLQMYLGNALFCAGVMLPMGIAYGMFVNLGFVGYFIWIVITLFTPLIPMTIASIVGAVIAMLGSFSKHKVLTQTVLSLCLLFGLYAFSFSLQGKDDMAITTEITQLGGLVQDLLGKIYPLSKWFANAITNKSLLMTFAYVGVSLLVYIIFVTFVSINYKAVNSRLMSGNTTSSRKEVTYNSNSVLIALAKKEGKRFFSSSTCVLNIGMGVIMSLAISVVAAIVGIENVIKMLGSSSETTFFSNNITLISYIAPYILIAIMSMTCYTAASLSLEGKNYWILQTLPLEKLTIYKGKILFNLFLLAPVVFIGNICLFIALKPGFILGLIYLIISIVYALFSSILGMVSGVKFVNFEWSSEVEVVKQGMATFISMFGNLIIGLLQAVIVYILSQIIDGRIAMLLVTAVVCFFTFILYKYLSKLA